MKLAGLFIVAALFTGSLAWPRVTPEVVYYADPQRGLYHGDKECAYSSSPTFADRADAGKLHPCHRCLPHASDKVAHRDSQNGQQNPYDDLPHVPRHTASIDRAGGQE